MASGPSSSESAAQKLNVNTLGCDGNTPLHEVVKPIYYNRDAKQLDENHIQFIKLLLKFNPDVNVKNSQGYTPLHLAISNQRSLNVLEALTKDSEFVFIDVDSVNKQGDAAIHEIPKYSGHEEAVKVLAFLISLKADINKRNSKDETILHVAITSYKSNVLIKSIIDHGANLNAKDMKNAEGYTPLHLAMKTNSSLDVLETLAKHTETVFIDVDSVNKQGDAAIHQLFNYRTAEDAVHVLVLLMKLKADINQRNAKDESVLNMAIAKNHSHLAKAIIDHGANVNVTDKQGCNPLYHAVFPSKFDTSFNFTFRDVGIVKHLVEKGAKIDMAAKNGYSPLLLAVMLKKTDYVKAMLENVSNLSQGGLEQVANTYCLQVDYITPTKNGYQQKNAAYPSKEYYNMTPLFISVYDCNEEMTHMLIKAGASVNAVNSKGENPLHMITKGTLSVTNQGKLGAITKVLIENGINLNAKDNRGGTALNYAIRNDKNDIVFHLLERGLDTL